jgi:hypothetical protein
MTALAVRLRVAAPRGRGGNVGFIAAATLLVAALALCINRVHNGDVYLELAAGRFVAHNGFVWHDPFPTIAAGREWLNQQWLSELFFYNLVRVVGMTGMTLLYALLLGLPLSWLLWQVRRRGVAMMAWGAALYFPTILAIVHPRAAAFSLAALAVLVALLLRGGRVTLAIPALFALWANLHGGFVAGLLLLGLVGVGALLDGRGAGRERPRLPRPSLRAAAVGVAALGATFATPLGPKVWEYVWSFHNPAISFATQEWEPAIHSPAVLVYVAVAAAFGVWLWLGSTGRQLTPLLVLAGFVALTLYSQRNVALLGPIMFYVIARCAPVREQARARRSPVVVVGAAAVAAVAVWAFVLGPARPAPYLKPRLVAEVLRHPPASGRIAAVAGVGSYLLWRGARTPVVINGWLEHYTPDELRGAYVALRPTPAGLRYIRALGIGGVITRSPATVRWLAANGFRVVASTTEGTYLVRSAPAGAASR